MAALKGSKRNRGNSMWIIVLLTWPWPLNLVLMFRKVRKLFFGSVAVSALLLYVLFRNHSCTNDAGLFFSCTMIWMICYSEVLLRLPYCTDLSIPMDDRLLVRWWMMVTVLPFTMIPPPFRHASIGIQDWQCVKIRNVGTCAGTLHGVFYFPGVFFFFLGGGGGREFYWYFQLPKASGYGSRLIPHAWKLVFFLCLEACFLSDLVVISHGPGSVGSVISWGYEVYRYFGTFSRSMLSMFVSLPQGRRSLVIIKHNISLGFHHHKKNGWPNFDDWNP